MWQVQVLPGELYVTREDEVIATVLGSCVSACVRDTRRGLGGMNHFMLPRPPSGDQAASARYGLYALECLVNAVSRGGGKREDLEVKVFGGGRVLEGAGDIGRGNIAFVHKFFADEAIKIAVEDVGGNVARRLRYWPRSGRVMVMHMPMTSATKVIAREAEAAAALEPTAGSVELF
jgi:chemotaxis protein CheD